MNKPEMNETVDESNQVTKRNPETKDLLEIIDKEFKERYWKTWLKHYLLDVIVSIMILLVLILVSITLFVIQPLFGPDTVEANLPIFLTSLALLISYVGLMLKWYSTPMASREEYVRELTRKNCEEISRKHKIANNLVLYALVGMKAINPKTNLMDAYSLSSGIFSTDELVKRFYKL